MKKWIIPFIGALLFVAGYQLARKQTAYVNSKVMLNGPAYAAKPIIKPIQTSPTFAFYLNKSFLSN